MNDITSKQIEAAAKAMCLVRKPRHPSLVDDDTYWARFGSRALYLVLAEAALRAALANEQEGK